MKGAQPSVGEAPSSPRDSAVERTGTNPRETGGGPGPDRKQSRSLRFTLGPNGASGLIFFAAGWIAALLTGGALTLVPATLAVLFALTGLREWRSARSIRVSLPTIVRARAGRGSPVALTLENSHPHLAVERVEARGGDGLGRSHARRREIGLVSPGQTWRGTIPVRFESRGLRSSMEVELHTRAPLGFVGIRLRIEVSTRVFVGPAVVGLRGYELPTSRRNARRHPHLGPARGQEEPAGLRPWRPGEGEARVHWRSSARLGRRVVREFENHDETPIEVNLVTPEDSAASQAFERAIQLSAALVEELARRGRRTWFSIDEQESRPLHSAPARVRALDRLAELNVQESRAPISGAPVLSSPRAREPRRKLVVSLDRSGETILDGSQVSVTRSPLGGLIFDVPSGRLSTRRRTS